MYLNGSHAARFSAVSKSMLETKNPPVAFAFCVVDGNIDGNIGGRIAAKMNKKKKKNSIQFKISVLENKKKLVLGLVEDGHWAPGLAFCAYIRHRKGVIIVSYYILYCYGILDRSPFKYRRFFTEAMQKDHYVIYPSSSQLTASVAHIAYRIGNRFFFCFYFRSNCGAHF